MRIYPSSTGPICSNMRIYPSSTGPLYNVVAYPLGVANLNWPEHDIVIDERVSKKDALKKITWYERDCLKKGKKLDLGLKIELYK